jgi:LytS/YehU family sensor histidine kinase
VAPLLYLAFIENAFKHGSKEKADDPFINIGFDLEHEDRVGFSIENRMAPFREKPRGGGFGLPNVKKRLELLYPGKHVLKIGETGSVYRVELTIFTV